MNYKILNKKQAKEIFASLEKQFGLQGSLEYVFLVNEKNRVYIANREVFDIDISKLKVNQIGLYFGELSEGSDGSIRLSFEGSQIIGPKATENILDLDDKELKQWLEGIDLEKNTRLKGYVLIRNNKDFYGCGKATKEKVLNFVPKIRRIVTED